MAEMTDKCANPNCNCPARSGQPYCSDHCMHANDNIDTRTTCGCGHADCATATKQTQTARH
ncbi:MAG: hypothetical protein U0Z53_08385 [Blastocatellia bacterium]